FLGPFIFTIWVGGKIPYDAVLLVLLAAATFVEVIWRMLNGPAYILNRHIVPAIAYVLVNAMLVPVGYLATQSVGQKGTALSVLAAELGVTALVMLLGVKVLKLSSITLAGKVLVPPLWLAEIARRVLSQLGGAGAYR